MPWRCLFPSSASRWRWYSKALKILWLCFGRMSDMLGCTGVLETSKKRVSSFPCLSLEKDKKDLWIKRYYNYKCHAWESPMAGRVGLIGLRRIGQLVPAFCPWEWIKGPLVAHRRHIIQSLAKTRAQAAKRYQKKHIQGRLERSMEHFIAVTCLVIFIATLSFCSGASIKSEGKI